MTTSEPGASEVFTHGADVSPRATAFRASSPAAIITDGFDVFVHDVIAAITTAPSASSNERPSASCTGAFWSCSVAPSSRRTPASAVANPAFAPESDTRSCGRAGPASDGSTVREVELQHLVVLRDRGRVVPEALLLRVRLDERDEIVGTAGGAQVAQRLVVDREQRARRAVLGRHVADRRPVLERDAADAFAVELHELADHAVRAQPLARR